MYHVFVRTRVLRMMSFDVITCMVVYACANSSCHSNHPSNLVALSIVTNTFGDVDNNISENVVETVIQSQWLP